MKNKQEKKLTILAPSSRSMVLAAATPFGSPSILMTLLLSSSGGIMMDVPVSVLMRFTRECGMWNGGMGKWGNGIHTHLFTT